MTTNKIDPVALSLQSELLNANRPLKKILLIRLSSLGDIILTTPVVRCTSTHFNAEIHYVTRKQNAFLVQHNPYINKVVAVDKDPMEQLTFFRSQHYDQVIDLHANLRSIRFSALLNRPTVRFNKLNVEKWLLVNLKIDRMPPVHLVDRYFDALKRTGVENDQQGLDYFLPPEAENEAREMVDIPEGDYSVIVAGAKHFTKQIPVQVARQITERVPGTILILGGGEDARKGEEIAAGQERVINCCGKLSFDASAWLIRGAGLVITSDTGLMHVAAAFRKPTLVLWGNTVPAFGMYPYTPGNQHLSINIESPDLKCRPCSKIGFDACPKQHFRCMRDANIDQIIAAAATIKTG